MATCFDPARRCGENAAPSPQPNLMTDLPERPSVVLRARLSLYFAATSLDDRPRVVTCGYAILALAQSSSTTSWHVSQTRCDSPVRSTKRNTLVAITNGIEVTPSANQQ